MRVLMVEHSGGGGMRVYTDAICSGLSQAGADVTILTSSKWPDKQRQFNIERNLLQFAAKEDKSSRLIWAADRAIRCTINSIKRNRFILNNKFDVVHFQGAAMPLFDQFFLKSITKYIPVVMTIHDVKPHFDSFLSKSSFLKRSLRIPHHLIVHYERGREKLIESWNIEPERISVVPHGIIPIKNPIDDKHARRNLNLPQDRQILLFFGRIRPNKGLDVLLRAIDKIRLICPDVLLIIAGAVPRGTSFEAYSKIIEELELSGNIRTFLNFVPDSQVDSFFTASNIIVLPYLNFEAQSGVLLRAYAHTKPIVVSDVGAMGELVSKDNTGLVIEPGNSEALVKAVIRILENPDEFRSNYSNELKKKYDSTKIAQQTMACYKKAIETKNNEAD